MRLARFAWGDHALMGVITGDQIQAIRGDPFLGWERGDESLPLSVVRLLAPVQPTKIIGVGANYGANHPEPRIFLKPPSAVIGTKEVVRIPAESHQVNCMGELAIVIGRKAFGVPREEALKYVLGYTCAFDVTAVDIYLRDERRARGKGFDTFCPLGPHIETTLNPFDLGIRSWVNGQEAQNARTSQMDRPVDLLVSFCSSIMTLHPGDVILTGAPPGSHAVAPGDTAEIEIEGIGRLVNPVRSRPRVGSPLAGLSRPRNDLDPTSPAA